jgi:autophagy-related protein 2
MTRFFEFSDDTRPAQNLSTEEPYLQRVEVCSVPVKMDYKPKKVDFAGLRSGRTTEFMNFFILEDAEFVLKHTIVYATAGFTKLRQSLEDVWMPDITHNQLPGVLSGLNGVRTVVNVGSGMRDLVMIPIQEYKKDGRVVRSITKGAAAFAKTTGGELTKFGARLAIGAQNALQGAEVFLAGGPVDNSWEDVEGDMNERRTISHYANQPAGILQGLKGAARSLERDILVTKDAIIAISGEMRDNRTAEGAARAVVRHAPTLILRPMIGASKAISQTLMGATNTVDPQNRRRVEEVSFADMLSRTRLMICRNTNTTEWARLSIFVRGSCGLHVMECAFVAGNGLHCIGWGEHWSCHDL